MELSRDAIEAFIRAYQKDTGKQLTFREAHEIAHRLVRVFELLQKADREDTDNTSSENPSK